MYFPPITELSMVGVADAGVPNQERILLRPTDRINLAQFGIMLCRRSDTGLVTPFRDQFFWFGEVEVTPPSWIVVFTGPGKAYQSVEKNFGQVYWHYWGKRTTVFTAPERVPVVLRMTSILIGSRILSDESQRKQLT
jgi:hypothetical protein